MIHSASQESRDSQTVQHYNKHTPAVVTRMSYQGETTWN